MVEQVEHCELCESSGGEIVWQDPLCRVVRIADPDYPGFCRVVWGRHVAEMTDLPSADRRHLLSVVFAVEAALRALYRPDKINLASLGNLVPHLHWHVIPRFSDDRHYPQPIWSKATRISSPARARVETARLHDAIVQALAEEQGGAAG
jgi:diadenosine tetraphosphate (Ap4A) HIT family hydrolase